MLQVQNISFAYTDKAVIQNVDFTVEQGQNIALIGESGCGKSTLLKLIYGMYDLTEGKIFYNQTRVLGPKYNLVPGMTFMKYLAQDFDLMPFETVAENVGKFLSNGFLPLKKLRIQELLEMVEMTEFAKVRAKDLSGGQQQRVALAMVLANEPKLLLLDEPFSQIDNFRKNELRRNLFDYLKKQQITCLIATHDFNDILSFSDKTIVLRHGKMIDINSPKNLYENPESKYIGSLFGEINEIESKYLKLTKNKNPIQLVYSFQLKIVQKSNLKVVVEQNYYRGNYFLIKASYNEKKIFFESKFQIETHSIVFLEIDEN